MTWTAQIRHAAHRLQSLLGPQENEQTQNDQLQLSSQASTVAVKLHLTKSLWFSQDPLGFAGGCLSPLHVQLHSWGAGTWAHVINDYAPASLHHPYTFLSPSPSCMCSPGPEMPATRTIQEQGQPVSQSFPPIIGKSYHTHPNGDGGKPPLLHGEDCPLAPQQLCYSTCPEWFMESTCYSLLVLLSGCNMMLEWKVGHYYYQTAFWEWWVADPPATQWPDDSRNSHMPAHCMVGLLTPFSLEHHSAQRMRKWNLQFSM